MTAPLLLPAPRARRRALRASPETRVLRVSRVAPAVPTTVPSLIILGTDAVLAAGPATPVQLAHACLAAGYHAAIPASWGDELIAARVLERLRDADGPVVQCSCPHVAHRLALNGDAIAPMLLCCVSPPVAVASYLRAAYAPSRPRLTYAGSCPGGSHESIDVWLSVEELMVSFAERGISATTQPTEFDSVLPPDRRRYFSEPGGIPSRQALRQLPASFDLLELKGGDLIVEIAQQLLTGTRTLIDVALPLGCACSGVTTGVAAEVSRARVRDSEPPRALGPIVDHGVKVSLDDTLHRASAAGRRQRVEAAEPEGAILTSKARASVPNSSIRAITARPAAPPEAGDVSPIAVEAPPPVRRRSPPGLSRPVLGSTPVSRVSRTDAAGGGGRRLPRAFVARLRSSPRGMRRSALKEGPSGPDVAKRRSWWLVASVGVAIGLAIASLLYGLF